MYFLREIIEREKQAAQNACFSCGQLRGGSRIASVQTASWSVFQRVMLTWHEPMPRFIFFLEGGFLAIGLSNGG
jgi:hypothetical protein